MSYSDYYELHVNNIRKLKLEREKAYDAFDGAVRDLASDIAGRLTSAFNQSKNKALYCSTLYKILNIKPVVDVFRNEMLVGVDIFIERADKYKPTDVERRKLATRPKGKDYNNRRLLFWLDEDEPLYVWKNLKNQIFKVLEYRCDLNKDGIEERIERLKLSIIPAPVNDLDDNA